MEQITKYVCGFCRTEFNSEARCLECESSHVPVIEFEGADYNEGKMYPAFVHMVSDDNHMLLYAYREDLGLYQQEESETDE